MIAVSADGGETWERRDAGLEDFSVRAIAIDPNDANFVVAGGLTGVYRSTRRRQVRGRRSPIRSTSSRWPSIRARTTASTSARGARAGARTTAARRGSTSPTGWCSTPTCSRSHRPANAGQRLGGHVRLGLQLEEHRRPLDALQGRLRQPPHPRRARSIRATRTSSTPARSPGLYRSDDGGKSWYVVSDEGLVINSIVLHPQRPERIVLGIEGDGVYVSQRPRADLRSAPRTDCTTCASPPSPPIRSSAIASTRPSSSAARPRASIARTTPARPGSGRARRRCRKCCR